MLQAQLCLYVRGVVTVEGERYTTHRVYVDPVEAHKAALRLARFIDRDGAVAAVMPASTEGQVVR